MLRFSGYPSSFRDVVDGLIIEDDHASLKNQLFYGSENVSRKIKLNRAFVWKSFTK